MKEWLEEGGALELTRPSGGAVSRGSIALARLGLNAWWTARLGQMPCGFPAQDQFSAKDAQADAACGKPDASLAWRPRCLLRGVVSTVGQLATLVAVDRCGRSPLRHGHALVLRRASRRASVVYPHVRVLAVPSRHRPARTAARNRTNRHQPAPQVTYRPIVELARNRQVGGSNPPSGSTRTPIDLRFAGSAYAAIVSSSRGVSVVRPSVQDASRGTSMGHRFVRSGAASRGTRKRARRCRQRSSGRLAVESRSQG
jgi:hypothetical protein